VIRSKWTNHKESEGLAAKQ